MTNVKKEIAFISTLGITCIKNAENPYFNSKYADLQTVVEALKKPLDSSKLVYGFTTGKDEQGNWSVRMSVMSTADDAVDTDVITADFPITATDPQKFGACVTYAKRYLLTTVFNVIADEDDDGNKASGIDVKPKPNLPKKAPATLDEQVNDSIPDFFD